MSIQGSVLFFPNNLLFFFQVPSWAWRTVEVAWLVVCEGCCCYERNSSQQDSHLQVCNSTIYSAVKFLSESLGSSFLHPKILKSIQIWIYFNTTLLSICLYYYIIHNIDQFSVSGDSGWCHPITSRPPQETKLQCRTKSATQQPHSTTATTMLLWGHNNWRWRRRGRSRKKR